MEWFQCEVYCVLLYILVLSGRTLVPVRLLKLVLIRGASLFSWGWCLNTHYSAAV
jgi:uncharacterized membrane protein